jgi:Tfp pilus assembly protein PilX
MKNQQTSTSGFAMLFTVLVMTLILNIALGISNITFKQTILSSLARDSGVAFYQADAGMECILYYDLNVNTKRFPIGSTTSTVPQELDCGAVSLDLDTGASSADYFVYESITGSAPCIAAVSIDKRGAQVILQSRGHNICQTHPRQVERALEVRY